MAILGFLSANIVIVLIFYGNFALIAAKSNPWKSEDIFSPTYNALQPPTINGKPKNFNLKKLLMIINSNFHCPSRKICQRECVSANKSLFAHNGC